MHITFVTTPAPSEPRRGQLRCPICFHEQVMPTAVDVMSLAGQRGALGIDRDGVHLDPTALPVEGGSAISITFRCRDGHRFLLRLRTIYASTTAETLLLPLPVAKDPERN